MRCAATSPASPTGRRAGASRAACCQGRMASGRAVPARRLHRHQPGATSQARRHLLQPARLGRAVDQGRQERDQMDAAVMPNLRRQCRPSPIARARLQPRQLRADAGDAQGGGAMVTDEPAGEADQDWREGRQAWPVRDVPDGRGRCVAAHVQGHPDAYCPASGAARASVRGAGIECDKQRRQECAMTKAKHQGLCATRREPIDSAAGGTHRG